MPMTEEGGWALAFEGSLIDAVKAGRVPRAVVEQAESDGAEAVMRDLLTFMADARARGHAPDLEVWAYLYCAKTAMGMARGVVEGTLGTEDAFELLEEAERCTPTSSTPSPCA